MMFVINDSHLYYTCLIIILCPLIWNILARLCHKFIPKKTSKTKRYIICYLLTIWIFSFSSYRDYLIRQTIQNQPKIIISEDYSILIEFIAIGLFLLGQIFVLSSFYKLGITGTFLGDYCGILMNAPVTTFPFNILTNPMYIGSTLSFLALALYYSSPIGFLLTIEIYIVYRIALLFEEPYTKRIYEEKNN
jgi:methylene-fatty-acyl-phospholipid synthase